MKKILQIVLIVSIFFLLLPLPTFAQTGSTTQQNTNSSSVSSSNFASPFPAVDMVGTALNTAYSAAAAVCNDPNKGTCEKVTAGCNPPSTTSKETTDFITKILSFIIILEKLLFMLNVPVIIIIGKLLSNDWVYLDNQVIGVLQNLWILVRNIFNIAFIPLLILVSGASVVGGGKDKKKFAIGSILPLMIPAVLFVNFSFPITKIILDIGNMATTAAFSIVNEVGPGLLSNNDKDLTKSLFCWTKDPKKLDAEGNPVQTCLQKNFYLYLGGVDGGNGKTESAASAMCTDPDIKKDTITATDNLGFAFGGGDVTSLTGGLFNARNAMFVYTYNVFRLPEVMKVFDTASPSINTLSGVTLNVIYAIFYCGMILLTNVVLLVAFATRMVLVWLILIFSPIMAFEIIFPDKKGKIPFMQGGFFHSILTLAFMPAICGFILSLGMLFYQVISASDIVQSGLAIPLWPFNIIIKGSWVPQFGNIMQMALGLLMIAVEWRAIIAALGTDKLIAASVKRIDDTVKSGAGLVKELIGAIPIIPIIGGEGKVKLVSAKIPNEVFQETKSHVRRKSREEGISAVGDLFGDTFGFMRQGGLSESDKRWIQEAETKSNDVESNKNIINYFYTTGMDQGSREDRKKIASYIMRSTKGKVDEEKLTKALNTFIDGKNVEYTERTVLRDALRTLEGAGGTDERLTKDMPRNKAEINDRISSSGEGKAPTVKVKTTEKGLDITVGDTTVTGVEIGSNILADLRLTGEDDATKKKVSDATTQVRKILTDYEQINTDHYDSIIEELKKAPPPEDK